MPVTAIQICQQCHARIADPTATQCPACYGALVPSPNQAVGETDHRGIILPPRHAVGGVITPR